MEHQSDLERACTSGEKEAADREEMEKRENLVKEIQRKSRATNGPAAPCVVGVSERYGKIERLAKGLGEDGECIRSDAERAMEHLVACMARAEDLLRGARSKGRTVGCEPGVEEVEEDDDEGERQEGTHRRPDPRSCCHCRPCRPSRRC